MIARRGIRGEELLAGTPGSVPGALEDVGRTRIGAARRIVRMGANDGGLAVGRKRDLPAEIIARRPAGGEELCSWAPGVVCGACEDMG